MKVDRILQIAALLLVGVFIYWHFSAPQRPSIRCEFVLLKGAIPFRAPTSETAITTVRIQGNLTKTTQPGMFSFDGSVEGSNPDAQLVGDVWVGKDRAVEGIFFYLQHTFNPSSGSSLNLATLNRDGQLDTDRSKAFLFFDKHEKLSHPASYACSGAGF